MAESQRTLLEVVRDTACSLVLNLAPRLASALLFIFLGHWAEPSQAGIFSLAVTYLVVLTSIMRGLDDLLIRQVSREPEQAKAYWINFSILRWVLSLLAYGGLLFMVLAILHYPRTTVAPILILALSLAPDGLTYVAQSVLIGQRQFGLPALVSAGTSLFQLASGALVVARGGDAQQIAWVWVAGSCGGMVVLLGGLLRRTARGWFGGKFSWDPILRNWRAALSFFFILFVVTLESQLDVVILSVYRREVEVGWYFAATTVLGGVTMLSRAYWQAMFPLLTRFTLVSRERGWGLYRRSSRYMGALIVPLVTGLVILASPVIDFVFGLRFQPATIVLQLISLALVFAFLSDCNSRLMQVNDRQSRTLWFVVISLAVNLVLNLALDPALGARGAALARIGSAMTYFVLSQVYVSLYLGALNLFRALAKPVGACLPMALTVWLVRDWPLAVVICLGIAVYGAGLLLLGWFSDEDGAWLWQSGVNLAGKLRQRFVPHEK